MCAVPAFGLVVGSLPQATSALDNALLIIATIWLVLITLAATILLVEIFVFSVRGWWLRRRAEMTQQRLTPEQAREVIASIRGSVARVTAQLDELERRMGE